MEPIAISVENQTPPAQARSPTQKETALGVKEDVKPEKAPDSSRLTELLDDVQKGLDTIHNMDLRFSVHEASGKIMVTVMEASSGEVIREIPPSAVLNLAAKLDEMVGVLFDQKG